MAYQNYELPFYEESVGSYGIKWLAFMHRNYPELVKQMKEDDSLLDVARSVDERAWEYRELLDNQYAQVHFRPTEFEEVVAWERTRMFYTDSAVMREKVLFPRTAA